MFALTQEVVTTSTNGLLNLLLWIVVLVVIVAVLMAVIRYINRQ